MSITNLTGPPNRFLTTWRLMRDPYTYYSRLKQLYGDTFLVRALNGNVIVTCNTENIRRIFAAPSDALGQFAVETIKPLMGESSVLLIEGEPHRRQRAVLSPRFRGDRISKSAEDIHDVAMRVAQAWQPGSRVCIMDATLEISLEVIIRVVFGVQSSARIEVFKQTIKQFVSGFHPVLGFTRLLQRPLFGLSPWNRFLQARALLYDLLDEEIAQRQHETQPSDNLLSGLMNARYEDGTRMSPSCVRDQLVTMLLAGHETTQIAMAWVMSWLHRYPEILLRLQNEFRSTDSLEAMLKSELLEGVCNESLRLNAIVSDLVRVIRRPLELEDIFVPANSNVGVAICLVHTDPRIYRQPQQFMPDRWSEKRYKPYEFMPFGGGIRRCIGAPLAELEMKTVAATWIKHFSFELPSDAPDIEPTYRRNITMAPRSGIPLLFLGNAN